MRDLIGNLHGPKDLVITRFHCTVHNNNNNNNNNDDDDDDDDDDDNNIDNNKNDNNDNDNDNDDHDHERFLYSDKINTKLPSTCFLKILVSSVFS